MPPIGSRMAYLHGWDSPARKPAVERASDVIRRAGFVLVRSPASAQVAIGPYLTRLLPPADLLAPALGTLIFHPSLLPRHRGPRAIHAALAAGDPYSGVTWFWGDAALDTGDICEQEVVGILPGETPGGFYHRAILPAMERTLAAALADIGAGHVRRRPQQAEHATWEGRHPLAVYGDA